MAHAFDPGYFEEPFRSLVGEFPGKEVCPPGQFRARRVGADPAAKRRNITVTVPKGNVQ